MGFPAKVEAKALLAPWVRKGPRVNVAPLAPLAKMGSQDPWGFQDLLELLGLLVKKGTREKWAPLVIRAAKAIKGMRAHQDQLGYRVL